MTRMTCTDPGCRHRTKRKLRPLVISLFPQSNDDSSSTNPSRGGKNSRHEQITQMFTSHPSLSAHFEPPAFSPGVSSRELRNRLKFLEHANNAGLIPEVEWDRICTAVRKQEVFGDDNDADGVDSNYGKHEKNISSIFSGMNDESYEGSDVAKHKIVDPFRYLATTTGIQPSDCDAGNENITGTSSCNENKSKTSKKKRCPKYKTVPLVPISPQRRGSTEDISLPYSVELWRKAKTLNRDRSVLACTLAHLMAMRRLVDNCENDTLSNTDGDGQFDFILEDNARAFVGIEDSEELPAKWKVEDWTGCSCECFNRIWDIIEASNEAAETCHMRYYGWLGSLPNLHWIYKNHIPRSAINGAQFQNNAIPRFQCTIFPFPTNDDLELDSDITMSKPKKQDGHLEKSQTPHFTTPGGTPVWGTFAYTISPAAYHTLIHKLQNDVGSLMWKGKRMRAFHAKPIDKILPRHVKSEFGQRSVHLPVRVAFVRAPMLGSLLHPQWEEGFCSSTETQYSLSCGGSEDADSSPIPFNSSSDVDGSSVWDHVWLAEEEKQLVKHKKKCGKWVTKADLEKLMSEVIRYKSVGYHGYALKMTQLAVSISIAFCLLYLEHSPHSALVAGFTRYTPIHNRNKRLATKKVTDPHDNTFAEVGDRRKRKLGTVSIISRTIPVEVEIPSNLHLPRKAGSGGKDEPIGNEVKGFNVTVWEMDKPSDLIQEWWSIDESERGVRVGDPFGIVMWPGSILASRELMKLHYLSPSKSPITNTTILVLGAGTGVEAQSAALLGAKKVIATDINPLTLKLLEYGAKCDHRIGDNIEGKYFDLFSNEPLPTCDILIASDVLYNPDLAKQVGRRLHEVIVRSFDKESSPAKIIITDSQNFHGTNFLKEIPELQELNALFKENNWEQLGWVTQKLDNFSGSGVLIDEDQVYDVEVRMIRWGWQW